MPAYTDKTERLAQLPDPHAFTPGVRALALKLATAFPTLRIDSIGLRDDKDGLVLMVDMSTTLEHVIDDPDLIAEIGAWQEQQGTLGGDPPILIG